MGAVWRALILGVRPVLKAEDPCSLVCHIITGVSNLPESCQESPSAQLQECPLHSLEAILIVACLCDCQSALCH